MNELRKAAEMALESLEDFGSDSIALKLKARMALRKALAQPEQEPVTLLPDGSAFGVMSFPLPKSHWLYAEREYRDGEYEPVELGKPILTHELRSAVVSAVRYAIRGATNCGKEMDFDPDALVQNAVYALCGPYTRHVDAVNISQERVDETAKGEYMIDCTDEQLMEEVRRRGFLIRDAQVGKKWVGLTGLEQKELMAMNSRYAVFETEARLKEKNG